MTDVLVNRGNLNTRYTQMEDDVKRHTEKSPSTNQGEKPGTGPSLTPHRRDRPC